MGIMLHDLVTENVTTRQMLHDVTFEMLQYHVIYCRKIGGKACLVL